MSDFKIKAGDCLAGGGGITKALKDLQDVDVKWVLNHDKIAIRTNMFNNKGVKHFHADMYKQNEREMEMVDFLWASIECTQHSQANGGREKKIGSYMLGWELIRYIIWLQPLVIGIENVPEFKKWAPLDETGKPDKTRLGEEFEKWKQKIISLGYDYHENINNAADYGIPTRRVRYFAFFTRSELSMNINWPTKTHSKTGTDGLKKWVACREYIDLSNEGESIFGRKLNPNIRKGKRKPLCHNTLKRIAGGIKKEAPELAFLMHYYGSGTQSQSLDKPLNTVVTKDRHALIQLEKIQFVQDHCHVDNYNNINEPLTPILTREQKQLITVEKQFVADYYSRDDTAHSLERPVNAIRCENSKHLVSTKANFIIQNYSGEHSSRIDEPIPTITTIDHNQVVTAKAQFISKQYNSNGNPAANNQSLNEPVGTLTTEEKIQFITAYFNSNGNPESQNQSLNNPLNTILSGTNKKALITAIRNGEFDFDIKMRFLDPEEMAQISTFPKGYFTNKLLKLTRKEQTRLIGNAVPPEWAKMMIEPVIKQLKEKLQQRKIAV
jgi:DNA (cytosine-5)-methyltransferase 1